MATVAIAYNTLGELLDHEQLEPEDPPTAKIINRLRHAKAAKELSRGEFLDICYWKSARSIRRCEKNSARIVETITQKIFSTKSEQVKLELLTSLQGVNIPTASAILTLTDPKRYGVIDIRVWQLLYELQSVRNNPSGQNFNFKQWYHYLKILRYHAQRLKVDVRTIELTLFKYHQRHQQGILYKSNN